MFDQDYLVNYKFTTQQFEEMNWHDCKIHAIAFDSSDNRLLLDIDYILKWIGPDERGYYSFWVSPATLIFKNVYALKIDINYELNTILEDIGRQNERIPNNSEYISENLEWEWTLETSNGEISFISVGYFLNIRSNPIHTEKQEFTIKERGGFSFLTETN